MKIFAILLLLLQLQNVIGSISEEKCEEYAGLIREKRFGADDLIAAFASINSPGKLPTTPGEFPHMVQLGYENGDNKVWACGGTLISDQYVLTAATCRTLEVIKLHNRRRRRSFFIQEFINKPVPEFISLDSKVAWVKLGDKIHGFQEIKVEEIIVHPDMKPPLMFNDIALLKLDQKINFGKYVRPACLYSGSDTFANKTVIGTGWGQERFGHYFSDDLLKVEMEVYPEEECKMLYSEVIEDLLGEGIAETQMCVGGHEEKKTLCLGDGGGPLQIKSSNYSNMYDIVGIISFGYTCNFPHFPPIATRVSSYIPWIESTVWPSTD